MQGESQPEPGMAERYWQNPAVENILVVYAIESSLAHVRMLSDTRIIGESEAGQIVQALQEIHREVLTGKWVLSLQDMDIHAALERRLKEMVGDLALRVRIAKSRNDQIATDIRLWLRNAVGDFLRELSAVREVLLNLADRDVEVVMPGYTHMQPAMPILLAHWWLAQEARFRRDGQRLSDLYKRINLLPLGAYALAGTDQPIDRALVATYLGFDGVIENSLDAVSDRDFVVEFAAAAAISGLHVTQLASELLLWSTQEFGFLRLRGGFHSKSPSMPQKHNPELLEMLRSRPAKFSGYLMEFLQELKALPVGFCQDMQACLSGLVDLVENFKNILDLTQIVLPQIELDTKRMKEQADRDLTNAGHAVDYLLARGFNQEKASEIVEMLVGYCKERHKTLSDLAPNEWAQFSPAFDREIYKYVTVEESVESRSSFGGTASQQVQAQLLRAREHLASDKAQERIVLNQLSVLDKEAGKVQPDR